MKSENNIKRNENMDLLRGIGMILVVIQHCGIGENIGRIILAFHMPLFFMISGYLYNSNNKNSNLKSFSIKKFNKLIIPYFYFELINLAISVTISLLLGKDINIIVAILSIITCINMDGYTGISLRLWFLPCMFVSSILFYCINIYAKNKINNDSAYILMGITLSIVSLILKKTITFRLPFTLDISLMSTAFICFGYGLKKLIDYLKKIGIQYNLIVFFISGAILLICTFKNEVSFYMYINQYGNYVFAIVGAISGVICTVTTLNIFNKLVNKILFKEGILWFNKNSLLLFPLHLEILYFINVAMSLFNLKNNILIFIVKLTLLVILIIPIVKIINNKFKFLLGRENQKSVPNRGFI